MTEPAPLSERNVGWLRYLHRKATTPDSWDREDHPHEHWDNTSDAPMLCYHRFDLIDSTYAVALMADRTPAWREVYEQILDELIFRHTGWWAAADWLTQIGDDPDRATYPEHYRMLIPPRTGGTTTCRAGPRTASSRGACNGIRSEPMATCSSRGSSS